MPGSQPLDTGTATGRLMLAVIGAVGQAEREAMLERQREGIAKAKPEGRYKGRVPTVRRQAGGGAATCADTAQTAKQTIASFMDIGRLEPRGGIRQRAMPVTMSVPVRPCKDSPAPGSRVPSVAPAV